jgi:dTDP-4-dehydrorhamnose 3,5-epimerase-like enzyme
MKVIEIPKIVDPRGNLSFIEGGRHVPFEIRRVYYLYDVPGGEARGGHSHLELSQLLIAASGSFTVVLDDGHVRQKITLNRPDRGLHITPGIWRELEDFSSGAVCLVLASHPYDEADYIRDYDNFLKAVKKR